MSKPANQCCQTCRYRMDTTPYDRTHNDDVFCVRYPPISFHDGYRVAHRNPIVRATHWCGEWSPENPETVSEAAATLARFVQLGDMTAARALADKIKEGDS